MTWETWSAPTLSAGTNVSARWACRGGSSSMRGMQRIASKSCSMTISEMLSPWPVIIPNSSNMVNHGCPKRSKSKPWVIRKYTESADYITLTNKWDSQTIPPKSAKKSTHDGRPWGSSICQIVFKHLRLPNIKAWYSNSGWTTGLRRLQARPGTPNRNVPKTYP